MRIGVDAGGTFTDFVIADKTTGVTKLFKALSTPSNPTLAIENGLKLISEDLGLSPEEVVSSCDLCINGTTVGLNALITHRGGKTGQHGLRIGYNVGGGATSPTAGASEVESRVQIGPFQRDRNTLDGRIAGCLQGFGKSSVQAWRDHHLAIGQRPLQVRR